MNHLALGAQQRTQIVKQAHLGLEPGYVVERKERKDKVVRTGLKPAKIIIFDEAVVPAWIQFSGLGDHLRRNVNANYVEAEVASKTSRASRPAAEVKRPIPGGVFSNDSRKISVCQVVSVGKLQTSVRLGPSRVCITIREG